MSSNIRSLARAKGNKWCLTCLLCGLTENDLELKDAVDRYGAPSALRLHSVQAHGITLDDMRCAYMEEIVPGEFYRWTLPGERLWLEADVPATPEELRPMPLQGIAELTGNPRCRCNNEAATHVLFDRRPGRERKGHVYLGRKCLECILNGEL